MVLEYLYEGDSTTSLGNQFQCTGPTQQHSSSYSWGACNAPLFCPLSLVLLLGATVKSRYALGGDLPTPPPRAAGCGTTRHRATTGPPTPAPTGHHRAPTTPPTAPPQLHPQGHHSSPTVPPKLHPQGHHISTHRAPTVPPQFPHSSTQRATTGHSQLHPQLPNSSPTNSTHRAPIVPPQLHPEFPPHSSPTAPPRASPQQLPHSSTHSTALGSRPSSQLGRPAPAQPIKDGADPSRAAPVSQWAKAAAPGRIQTRRGAGAADPMEPRLVGPGPYRATRLVSAPAAPPDTASGPGGHSLSGPSWVPARAPRPRL